MTSPMRNPYSPFRDRALAKHGAVDILVNNSVARPMRTYGDSLETWRQSMDTNASGLFAISRAFLESMTQKGAGSVINISSIQGTVAPDFSNYVRCTSPDRIFTW